MPEIELLCLANSRKRHGHCVAGIDLQTGQWIRPVSSQSTGTLYENHYTLNDGSIAAPLDHLRLTVRQPYPLAHHPEDWTLDESKPWQLISRGWRNGYASPLENILEQEAEIFGGTEPKIPYSRFAQEKANASLALVKADSVMLSVKPNPKGTRNQYRVRFSHSGVAYNLPLTDPQFDAVLDACSPSEVPMNAFGLDDSRLYAVVSLSEPFNKPGEERICYKIVATLLELPL